MKISFVPFIPLVAWLTGCAATSPPPLMSSHPASPNAPEGARLTLHSSLRPDETTRQSHAQLSTAQREQEHWDKFGPVSGTPEEAPKSTPEVKHESH